ERIWRTARGIRSFGSFHGNMLTSAFGASIAASMATAYGCAGISSGRMSTGVWHARTKSRVTVNTKSGLVRYILVRKLLDHLHRDLGPALDQLRTPARHIGVVAEGGHLRDANRSAAP